MSLRDLKKKRESQLEKFAKESKASDNSYNNKDDRFWQPTVDSSGNGSAVIRFLPEPEGEDLPWVKNFSHGFQANGGWLIENCPTTIGKKCPVCEANGELWNSGIEDDKKIVSQRKRKLTYVSNIYVVKDPGNKDNEGKVFLYRYGKKIFDKINNVMNPEFDDQTQINPFDLWEGADFRLRARKYEGFRNYDASEFGPSSALSDDDDELESIYKQVHSLEEFVSEDQFKSYDDLKAHLDKVLNRTASSKTIDDEDEPVKARETKVKVDPEASYGSDDDDDEDVKSFFDQIDED